MIAPTMRISDQTLNRLATLKAIRRYAPVSRSQLPVLTALSSGTITQLTADLLKRGIVTESRDTAKRNGRPRTYLEIATGGKILIGASILGQGKLGAVFVDLAGNELFSCLTEYGTPASLEELASMIGEALDEAIGVSPFAASVIARIGLALPAVVDSNRGEVHFVSTFPYSTVPFAAPLSRRLGIPVTIENEMACRARAEHWSGCAQDLENFTLIHVGHMVGSAEYVDGLPRTGANGLNPEFGHLKTDFGDTAPHCLCGARGCVAMFSSMYGILQNAELLTDVAFPPIRTIDQRFERFLDLADNGDERARRLLARAGFHLGRAVANHVNINDPGTIVLSVLSKRFLDYISDAFTHALAENAMPGVLPSTDIRQVVAVDGWRQTGTAALALEQTYLSDDREPKCPPSSPGQGTSKMCSIVSDGR